VKRPQEKPEAFFFWSAVFTARYKMQDTGCRREKPIAIAAKAFYWRLTTDDRQLIPQKPIAIAIPIPIPTKPPGNQGSACLQPFHLPLHSQKGPLSIGSKDVSLNFPSSDAICRSTAFSSVSLLNGCDMKSTAPASVARTPANILKKL